MSLQIVPQNHIVQTNKMCGINSVRFTPVRLVSMRFFSTSCKWHVIFRFCCSVLALSLVPSQSCWMAIVYITFYIDTLSLFKATLGGIFHVIPTTQSRKNRVHVTPQIHLTENGMNRIYSKYRTYNLTPCARNLTLTFGSKQLSIYVFILHSTQSKVPVNATYQIESLSVPFNTTHSVSSCLLWFVSFAL